MKKYFYIIASLLFLSTYSSCSEKELDLFPPSFDDIADINTETKLQQFLNGAYLRVASTTNYGAEIIAFGDILSDHAYVVNNRYQFAANLNYNSLNNEFAFYGSMYDIIVSCNTVINNEVVQSNANVVRIKAEAKILRAFSYFTLVNYFSPTPSSGINQEYGVPLVLTNYDSSITPARATVAEVYNQIITDLNDGLKDAPDVPFEKVTLSKTAAKLLLSKVYLTRRATGDAQLALQYSNEILSSSPNVFAPVSRAQYQPYFAANPEASSENQPETIWELDLSTSNNVVTGIGSNLALPGLFYRADPNRSIMFTTNFFTSFPDTDIRRKGTEVTVANGLLTTTGAGTPAAGAWTNKYPRLTESGIYVRNLKIMRFSEARLNRIEALNLTGQTAIALTELNAFASSRGGSTYTGVNLLADILKEREKEFYGEGQRFLDLKRYSQPLIKSSNCTANCNVPANDKLFVLPVPQPALNANPNLNQYPGY